MDTPAIKFGTDGWRGVIADDFTFDNVALVATAIQRLLEEEDRTAGVLLIGYDRRFGAEAYAAHLAAHLEALGRQVVVVAEPTPTPAVAFGVAHLAADGAIQLTASHNPYYYQGLKFIPHFAGPALPQTTDRITALIQELAPGFTPPPLALDTPGELIKLREPYFERLDAIINVPSLASRGPRVLYNAMHGVGAGFLDAYLKRAGLEVVTINGERDVYFGGGLPDPSPANLRPLTAKLIEENCQVLIGTDGDADRFGLVDHAGNYFGANQALPLLADYLINYRRLRGPLVRTVSTSHLLDEVAREHELELIETAVGFKYVGEELRRGALIGGEESGGISVRGHIPEKDGILTSVLMLELAATAGESFQELYDKLQARLGARAFVRIDQQLAPEHKQRLFERLAHFAEPTFAGKKIASRSDMDGVRFMFQDGSWLLMRASGTEPLVRVYIETTAPDYLNKWRAQVLDAVDALAR